MRRSYHRPHPWLWTWLPHRHVPFELEPRDMYCWRCGKPLTCREGEWVPG